MMNRTTEIVAPYPNWVRSAPLKYRYVSIVCDAFAGPPRVMIQTRSKSWSEPMTARKIQILIVGPSSGSMIRLVICHDEAPSMAAASRSSDDVDEQDRVNGVERTGLPLGQPLQHPVCDRADR